MPRPATMSDEARIHEIFSSIQGEGYLAGCRQIFIRFSDCNLNCRYCDTRTDDAGICHVETRPGSGAFMHLPRSIPFYKLIAIISGWKEQMPGAHHSLSITGGEPLLHVDTLVEWLPTLRRFLPIHLETNGTMHIALEQIVHHLDYISMDMKLPSTSGCTEDLWEIHRLFLDTASCAAVSVKVVVGEETTEEEIRKVCSIILAVRPNVPLFLQPLTLPGGGLGITCLRLLALQANASELLANVRVMPQMHKLLGVL